jgi:hypothetical protein
MADFYEGPTGRKRLLRTFEVTLQGTFDDVLHSCAVTTEDAMILGGARPGTDYVRLDIYKLAMPLAIALAQKNQVAITSGIPDSHPHAGLESASPKPRDLEAEVLEAVRQRGSVSHQHLAKLFRDAPRESAAAAKKLCALGKLQRRLTVPGTYAKGHVWVYELRAAA